MEFKALKWTLACVSLLFVTFPAAARDAECELRYAEITDLREPEFSFGSSWNMLYAEDGMDVFADLVEIAPMTVVAAGAYTKDKDDQTYHPLLVKFDDRLHKVWEVREETKEQRTIYRIVKSKSGFTVLGDLTLSEKGQGIYIASYNDDGKMVSKPSPIFEGGGNLDAKALIPAQDGGGYIVAAQFVNSKDQEDQYGLLYKVTPSGKVVWRRAFKPGRSTVVNDVQATQDGNYVVAGQIVTSATQSGGWLIRVDQKGAIQWQQTYPRGAATSFQTAAQTKDGNFIVTGKVRPFGDEGKGLSALVMKMDLAGNALWQRYFSGDYNYDAPGSIVYEDGRAVVLLNGGGMDSEHRSHARLMTFTPQGNIRMVEDFTDGQNAAAQRLVPGMKGERIITGYAQTSFGERQEGNEAAAAPVYTYDAWILAAPPLDYYEDPCAPSKNMSPILP